MRDLREVRMSKIRAGVDVLDAGGGIKFNGVGGLEVCEGRGFIGGVIDGLRCVLLFFWCEVMLIEILDASPPPKNKRDETKKPRIEKMAMEGRKMMMTICYSNEQPMARKMIHLTTRSV